MRRASAVCELVPWDAAEAALLSAGSRTLLLPTMLYYPSSAPLLPCPVATSVRAELVDRLQMLGQIPHVAPLVGLARHPSEPRSILLYAWPERGTFAGNGSGDETGAAWLDAHPWRMLLTVFHSIAVALWEVHAAGEAHGAVNPSTIGCAASIRISVAQASIARTEPTRA